MAHVTLIGEKIAKKDLIFKYLGPEAECKNCKLKNVCFNLKIDRYYKIINVRDKKHNCKIHEGAVSVVEVEEQPIITTINKKITEGSTTIIEKEKCNNIGCEHYKICQDFKPRKDQKYKIKKIINSIDCPIGYELQKAEIQEE